MREFIHKYHLKPLFLLFVVLILYYFPVLFLGRTLQGPEMARMNPYLKSPPSPEVIISAKVMPQIFMTEQATSAYAYTPYDYFIGKSYKNGELPLWNPHQGLGLNPIAMSETAALFPLRILQDIFPRSTRDWFFILHIWLAGVFAYCFFISTGLNRFSAFFGSVLYMSSGAISWFMQLQSFLNVAMMLPLLMLSTHLLRENRTGKNIAFLAVTTGLMLYAGMPEPAFYCFLLSGIYYLYRTFSSNEVMSSKIKSICIFTLSTVLGFLIASPLLLLFTGLYQHSFSIHHHDIENSVLIAGIKARTPIYALPGILFPKILDRPFFPFTLPTVGIWDFIGSYIGIIPLFFISMGLFIKQPILKKDFYFFIAFTIIILLMDVGVWPFNLIGYLPIFSMAWSPRWAGAAWGFASISAAAFSLQMLQNLNSRNVTYKKVIKKALIITGIILWISLVISAQKGFMGNPFIFYIHHFLQQKAQIMISAAFAITCVTLTSYILLRHYGGKKIWIACCLILITAMWYYLPKGNFIHFGSLNNISIQNNYLITKIIMLVFAILFLSTVLLYVKEKKKTAILGAAFVFTIVILNSALTLPGYPKKMNIAKPTPFITYLQNHAKYQRIFSMEGILIPSYASVFGLYDIRFTTAMSYLPFQHFLEHYIKKGGLHDARPWFDATKYAHRRYNRGIYFGDFYQTLPKALDLLSVSYVITTPSLTISVLNKDFPGFGSNLSLAYHDTRVNIFKNSMALKRAYIVDKYQYAKNYKSAQKMVMKKGFNIHTSAVLNMPAQKKVTNNKTPLNARATITDFKNTNITIKVVTNKPALLVLNDIDYPGWEAKVDGGEAKIHRVNGLVRGVFVPKGNHVVIFSYFPDILKISIVIFICSLLIVFLLIFIRRRNT